MVSLLLWVIFKSSCQRWLELIYGFRTCDLGISICLLQLFNNRRRTIIFRREIAAYKNENQMKSRCEALHPVLAIFLPSSPSNFKYQLTRDARQTVCQFRLLGFKLQRDSSVRSYHIYVSFDYSWNTSNRDQRKSLCVKIVGVFIHPSSSIWKFK